jgi:hypothetical protein
MQTQSYARRKHSGYIIQGSRHHLTFTLATFGHIIYTLCILLVDVLEQVAYTYTLSHAAQALARSIQEDTDTVTANRIKHQNEFTASLVDIADSPNHLRTSRLSYGLNGGLDSPSPSEIPSSFLPSDRLLANGTSRPCSQLALVALRHSCVCLRYVSNQIKPGSSTCV